MPVALRPFEAGVWTWCTIVTNLANLIMADRHWARSSSWSGLPPADVWAQLPLRVRARLLARWAAMVRGLGWGWRGGGDGSAERRAALLRAWAIMQP